MNFNIVDISLSLPLLAEPRRRGPARRTCVRSQHTAQPVFGLDLLQLGSMSRMPRLLVPPLLLLLAGAADGFVPTALPAQPKENARVLVAPCSPLMAAQQRWNWPSTSTNGGAAAPLTLLSAPHMALHLEEIPQQAHLVAVLRTVTNASAVPRWTYIENTSALQLEGPATRALCLHHMQNGQFANIAAGQCPAASWRSSVADINPLGGLSSLELNQTDQTIRFVFRDSYNLNSMNFTTCLTATWGEPCEPAEFARLPFCDSTKSAEERLDDLISRASVDEQVAMLSNDNANRPWLVRLSVNPNNTQQEALHGAGPAGGAPASSHHSADAPGTGFGTSFPHALALAATLNRTLWELVGRSIAMESR
jgi:hypothetical protein